MIVKRAQFDLSDRGGTWTLDWVLDKDNATQRTYTVYVTRNGVAVGGYPGKGLPTMTGSVRVVRSIRRNSRKFINR